MIAIRDLPQPSVVAAVYQRVARDSRQRKPSPSCFEGLALDTARSKLSTASVRCLCTGFSLATAVAGGVAACCAVAVLGLGDLAGIRTTKQSHGPAVLDDGGGELAVVVVARPPHVQEASEVRSGVVAACPGLSLGQGSGLSRTKRRALLSPRAEKGSCIGLGILVADRAGFAEHVGGGLVRRVGLVVEVGVVASWLLQEPRDVLYVCRNNGLIGVLLRCVCIFGTRQ